MLEKIVASLEGKCTDIAMVPPSTRKDVLIFRLDGEKRCPSSVMANPMDLLMKLVTFSL